MRSVEGHYKVLRLVLNRDYACTPDTQISNLNNIIKYGPVNKEEAVFYYYYRLKIYASQRPALFVYLAYFLKFWDIGHLQ